MDQKDKETGKENIEENRSNKKGQETQMVPKSELDRQIMLASLQLVPRQVSTNGEPDHRRKVILDFQRKLPNEIMQLKVALMKCIPLFPIQVGTGVAGVIQPKVRRVHLPLICDKKLAEGAISGPTLCSSSRIVLDGDEILSDEGKFKFRLSGWGKMEPRLVAKFRLKQIRESASEFERALHLLNAIIPTKIVSLAEALLLLQPIIEAIESAQAVFLAPYARTLEEEHLKLPHENKCVFKDQPTDFDVNFYIDDHKLVFRGSFVTKKDGEAPNYPSTFNRGTMVDRHDFKISVKIPWARDLGSAYIEALCVAKTLGHKMRCIAENFGEFE